MTLNDTLHFYPVRGILLCFRVIGAKGTTIGPLVVVRW